MMEQELELSFKDEVIYITGASAGIGFATAKLCLQKGATVVITGRNTKNLQKAEAELLDISPAVIAHNLDVSNESEIIESLDTVYKSCGKIDGLVNNAPSIHTGKIIDLDFAAWKTNFKANLDAVFLTTKKSFAMDDGCKKRIYCKYCLCCWSKRRSIYVSLWCCKSWVN